MDCSNTTVYGGNEYGTEMPLFRKFPEIRKFEIEKRTSGKMKQCL